VKLGAGEIQQRPALLPAESFGPGTGGWRVLQQRHTFEGCFFVKFLAGGLYKNGLAADGGHPLHRLERVHRAPRQPITPASDKETLCQPRLAILSVLR